MKYHRFYLKKDFKKKSLLTFWEMNLFAFSLRVLHHSVRYKATASSESARPRSRGNEKTH